MEKKFDYVRSKAFENVDYHYFVEMIKPNWTVTPSSDLDSFTSNDFISYDATVTNGNEEYIVELKGREMELTEDILQDGCLIDKPKVDALEQYKHAYIIQFFYPSNRTFVWGIHDKRGWKQERRMARANNTSQDRVEKDIYLMPFTEENERNIDLSDYQTIFDMEYERLNKIKNKIQ